jgi:pimeloyl-ACP methyl ester carboxylesterase
MRVENSAVALIEFKRVRPVPGPVVGLTQTILVDPRPLLASIRAPTLLVWGERDAMIPFTNSAEYLKAIPDARLVAIPGAGHLPQEEAAVESLAAVEAFLTH